jgi:epoxyqueuosine reductase QueG
MLLNEHPTVKQYREKRAGIVETNQPTILDAHWLRQLCLEAGADDVGFVELARPELSTDRQDILAAFPKTKTLISFVCRMNREPIRSPARSVANLEFHQTGDRVNDVARSIVATLDEHGVHGLNPAMGFPMEMDRFPGKVRVVSHKPVAVAAGLGQMGIHRNVIHPKFGSFVLLGTVLLDAEVSHYDRPIDYNPCLECKLCVAACPTGAIGADGHFNFSVCYTHNYREFMGGFTEWVERIADSKNSQQYRQKVTDSESASMWQSLSFGANYKAAYCLAVCPAGEDVIGPFLTDRKSFTAGVVKPLQDKIETVYVVPGSDADTHVGLRFPHKRTKHVASGLRPTSIQGFLNGLPLVFQRDRSKGLDATYHFTFTGEEACQATVLIRNKILQVRQNHVGIPNIRVTADSRTWLGFVRKERSLLWALLTRRVRIKGSPRLLVAFGNCFPS